MLNYIKAYSKYADGSVSKNANYWFVERDEHYGFIYRNARGGFCLKECIDIIESGTFSGTKEKFISLHRKEFYAYLIKKNSPYG